MLLFHKEKVYPVLKCKKFALQIFFKLIINIF